MGCVAGRQDIKFKEDLKHLKGKEKKLKETVTKEEEKAVKARDAIPKQHKAIKEVRVPGVRAQRLAPRSRDAARGIDAVTL